jgi:hypothetical protein
VEPDIRTHQTRNGAPFGEGGTAAALKTRETAEDSGRVVEVDYW